MERDDKHFLSRIFVVHGGVAPLLDFLVDLKKTFRQLQMTLLLTSSMYQLLRKEGVIFHNVAILTFFLEFFHFPVYQGMNF